MKCERSERVVAASASEPQPSLRRTTPPSASPCSSSARPAPSRFAPWRSASAPAARPPRSAPTSRCSRSAGRLATTGRRRADERGGARHRAGRPVPGAVPRPRARAGAGDRHHVPAATGPEVPQRRDPPRPARPRRADLRQGAHVRLRREADLTPGDRLPTADLDTAAGSVRVGLDDLLRPRVPRGRPRADAGRRRGPADAERVPAAGRSRGAVPRPRVREHGRRGDGQLRGGGRTRIRTTTTRATAARSPSAASPSTPPAGPSTTRWWRPGASSRSRSRASTSTPCARTARARCGATRTAGRAPTPPWPPTARRATSSGAPTPAGPSTVRPRPARRAARRSAAALAPARAGASRSTCRPSGSAS